jgi:hypothetical protein
MIATGYAGEDLPERARQERAVGLLSKPFQMECLRRSVRETLDRAQPQQNP